MRFSIITVCLNRVNTIERAIRSVIDQKYGDIEYIIIDGGSTDGTLDIIKKYENDIAYWVSEKDGGIYDAMNKGIHHATGEIIAFLNSDDWYEEDILSEVVKELADKEIQILCGSVYYHHNGTVSRYCVSKQIEEEIRYRMVYWQAAMFVRKKVFEECGEFDTQYQIAADYDWMLRIYDRHINIAIVDRALANFSYGGISTQADMLELQAEEGKKVALLALERNQELTEKQKMEWKEIIEKEYVSGIDNYKFKKVLRNMVEEKNEEIPSMIRQAFKRDHYAVFGCGIILKEVSIILNKLHISVTSLWDNDSRKWGKYIDGIKIGNPDNMKLGQDVVIIASTNYENEIRILLERKGFKKDIDYLLYSEMRHRIVDLAEGKRID